MVLVTVEVRRCGLAGSPWYNMGMKMVLSGHVDCSGLGLLTSDPR